MRFPADRTVTRVVALVLVTAVAGGFAAAAWRHRGPAAPSALVAAVDRAKGAAAVDSARHATAVVASDATRDTLHRAVVVYDTVRKTLVLSPVTRADTARLLGQIPAFVLSADRLRQSATDLERRLLDERLASARLDSGRVRTIAAQDRLVDALRSGPRVASAAEGRYDPWAHVPGIAARVSVRVVRDWSAGAGGELWLASGERGRAYLLVSHPIF